MLHSIYHDYESFLWRHEKIFLIRLLSTFSVFWLVHISYWPTGSELISKIFDFFNLNRKESFFYHANSFDWSPFSEMVDQTGNPGSLGPWTPGPDIIVSKWWITLNVQMHDYCCFYFFSANIGSYNATQLPASIEVHLYLKISWSPGGGRIDSN